MTVAQARRHAKAHGRGCRCKCWQPEATIRAHEVIRQLERDGLITIVEES